MPESDPVTGMERYWANYHDPADPPEGHVVVPLWPFTPSGCRPVPSEDDPFKWVWRGGQYVSGPMDPKQGLCGVGVPIRVRSYAYAKQLCDPPAGIPRLACWPGQMGIKEMAPVYRKNTKFLNENRWK